MCTLVILFAILSIALLLLFLPSTIIRNKRLRMKSQNHYIRGQYFFSYEEASKHFDVDHVVAMRRLTNGAPIDMVYGDRPALNEAKKESTNTFLKYIKPEQVKLNTGDTLHNERRSLPNKQTSQPYLTFKSLRHKHPYYAKRFNLLHKFIDNNAVDPGASLAVVNGNKVMLEDIRQTIEGRWLTINNEQVIANVHINDIQDVSYESYEPNYHGIVDKKILDAARFSGMTIIDLPGGLMPSRLQSSLGNLLRRRINLALPTILLTDRNFLSSLEHYESYLDETISEYREQFTIIDINPKKVL
jgi:hypothetical protein